MKLVDTQLKVDMYFVIQYLGGTSKQIFKGIEWADVVEQGNPHTSLYGCDMLFILIISLTPSYHTGMEQDVLQYKTY